MAKVPLTLLLARSKQAIPAGHILPSNALQVMRVHVCTICDLWHCVTTLCLLIMFISAAAGDIFLFVGTATNSPLPFIELYVRHTHTHVCIYVHTHTCTHAVMYKGQHKSETGIVTKREFDLLRIRRGCQGHPAAACGAAFPYIFSIWKANKQTTYFYLQCTEHFNSTAWTRAKPEALVSELSRRILRYANCLANNFQQFNKF